MLLVFLVLLMFFITFSWTRFFSGYCFIENPGRHFTGYAGSLFSEKPHNCLKKIKNIKVCFRDQPKNDFIESA